MTKRILSVVLALTMVFGAFAICANAALGSDNIGLVVTTDKTTGVKVDDIVTVTFAFEQDASNTYNLGSGNIVIAYNGTYFTPNGTESTVRTFGSNYPCYEAATTPNLAMYSNISATLTTAEATDYTAAIGVPLSFDANVVASAKAGYACTSGAAVFTLSFKCIKDVDKDVKFGVPATTLGGTTNLKYATGTKATKYAADKMDISKGVATITASAGTIVANAAEKVRWTGGVAGGTMDIGLTATVTGVGTLVAGPQTDITEIGFKYSTTSSDYETIKAGSNKVTSNNLYNTSTAGTYTFRAIIGDTDTTSTTAINAVAYVVYKGETYYAPDVISVVPATVVTRLLPS